MLFFLQWYWTPYMHEYKQRWLQSQWVTQCKAQQLQKIAVCANVQNKADTHSGIRFCIYTTYTSFRHVFWPPYHTHNQQPTPPPSPESLLNLRTDRAGSVFELKGYDRSGFFPSLCDELYVTGSVSLVKQTMRAHVARYNKSSLPDFLFAFCKSDMGSLCELCDTHTHTECRKIK